MPVQKGIQVTDSVCPPLKNGIQVDDGSKFPPAPE
jgi:hypothetical protein